ncbi:unnamed protein product, partial [Urochloa humidicola]
YPTCSSSYFLSHRRRRRLSRSAGGKLLRSGEAALAAREPGSWRASWRSVERSSSSLPPSPRWDRWTGPPWWWRSARPAVRCGAGLAPAYVAALVFRFLLGFALPLLRQGPRGLHLLLYRQMAASVLVAGLLFSAGLRSCEMAERLKLKELELEK